MAKFLIAFALATSLIYLTEGVPEGYQYGCIGRAGAKVVVEEKQKLVSGAKEAWARPELTSLQKNCINTNMRHGMEELHRGLGVERQKLRAEGISANPDCDQVAYERLHNAVAPGVDNSLAQMRNC